MRRHHLAPAKLISIAEEINIQKSGTRIISTNVKGRKPAGEGNTDHFYQAFFSA